MRPPAKSRRQNHEATRRRGTLPRATRRELARINTMRRVGRTASAAEPGTQALRELARRHGIEPFYLDMAGITRRATPATLKAVLSALGVPAKNELEARDSLREAERRAWLRMLQPVAVAWDGRPTTIDLRLPARPREAGLHCMLELEDGRARSLDCHVDHLRVVGRAEIDGKSYFCQQLNLPRLPQGYHHLELEAAGRRDRCLIISAPSSSFSPPAPPGRFWGFFLPMYAAHGRDSWGGGNLRDWRRLMEWTAKQGGRLLGTPPILAAFLDEPLCEPSPYSPTSRLMWNEYYLDITSAPEFAQCSAARRLVESKAFQQKLEAFRQSSAINYRDEMRARRGVLELMAKWFLTQDSRRRKQFERFLAANPRVIDYAEFRAATEATGKSWHAWPERMRRGKLEPGDYLKSAKNYHLYAQWLAREQMEQFTRRCRHKGLQLYLDLPLGVHPDGYDLWRERDSFVLGTTVGAPPDPCFPLGQDWGFAPLDPQRIREREYDYVLEYLRFQMRHTGLLRLDHVMGLHRLFWVPSGLSPSEGAYVSYPAEEFYALLSLESHRHQTAIAGENLGTVPPEVNAAMARHQLRTLHVMQYEVQPGRRPPLSPPPHRCVASLNTHDMPPFTSWWRDLDINERFALGLINSQQKSAEQDRRRAIREVLKQWLRQEGWLKGPEADTKAVLCACLKWLAATPAEFVLLNLEDLWQEEVAQNVPGTAAERANWRCKSRLTLEQIEQSSELRGFLQVLDRLRAGRAKRTRARDSAAASGQAGPTAARLQN